jgi:hypothetical protein
MGVIPAGAPMTEDLHLLLDGLRLAEETSPGRRAAARAQPALRAAPAGTSSAAGTRANAAGRLRREDEHDEGGAGYASGGGYTSHSAVKALAAEGRKVRMGCA